MENLSQQVRYGISILKIASCRYAEKIAQTCSWPQGFNQDYVSNQFTEKLADQNVTMCLRKTMFHCYYTDNAGN